MADDLRMEPVAKPETRTAEQVKRRLQALAGAITRNADSPTWTCASCEDGDGYVVRIDRHGIAHASPCIDCEKGKRIIAGDVARKQRAENKAKRDAVASAARGEDLPI